MDFQIILSISNAQAGVVDLDNVFNPWENKVKILGGFTFPDDMDTTKDVRIEVFFFKKVVFPGSVVVGIAPVEVIALQDINERLFINHKEETVHGVLDSNLVVWDHLPVSNFYIFYRYTTHPNDTLSADITLQMVRLTYNLDRP
jgi:hypothetical protein